MTKLAISSLTASSLTASSLAASSLAAALTVAIAAVAAAQTPPPPTRPSPTAPLSVFAAFHDICLDTQGEAAKAVAHADALGWTAPAAGDVLPMGDLALTESHQRVRLADSGEDRVVVGYGADPVQSGDDKLRWRVCIVSGAPLEPTAKAALAAWARVAPVAEAPGPDGGALFLIADPDSPQRRTAKDLPEAQVKALAERHALVAVGVKAVGPLTVLLFATPAS
jgi:hypothetical protein